jgi:hypothetical protein
LVVHADPNADQKITPLGRRDRAGRHTLQGPWSLRTRRPDSHHSIEFTHNTPELGSNGEDRRERDGYKSAPRFAPEWLIATFGGSHVIATHGDVEKLQATVTFAERLDKTGYDPIEDNRQVPSSTKIHPL